MASLRVKIVCFHSRRDIRAGVKHLEDCPVEPYIPIYLLVGGCFGLLKVLSMLWMQVRYRRYRTVDDSVDDDDDDDAEQGIGGTTGAPASPRRALAV